MIGELDDLLTERVDLSLQCRTLGLKIPDLYIQGDHVSVVLTLQRGKSLLRLGSRAATVLAAGHQRLHTGTQLIQVVFASVQRT